MNDLIPGTRVGGQGPLRRPGPVRRRTSTRSRSGAGSAWSSRRPNPFPKSIYDNVAFGPRINGFKGDLDELVERSLRRAALWDDVKDKLKQSGLALSGGQQQRLCIARAIAVEPGGDPDGRAVLGARPALARSRSRSSCASSSEQYTIVIVTHNMQQAARASDYDGVHDHGRRSGRLRRGGGARPSTIFTNPKNQLTEDYVSGRFG